MCAQLDHQIAQYRPSTLLYGPSTHFYGVQHQGDVVFMLSTPYLGSVLAQRRLRLALLAACACMAGRRKPVQCNITLLFSQLCGSSRALPSQPCLCAQCLLAHKAALGTFVG